MEKNRYTNQNLSKGQVSETKKSQDVSVKWPRQSKRRGDQSDTGNHRHGAGSGKQVPNQANKTRNQNNYNYDARQRSQRPPKVLPDGDVGEGDSAGLVAGGTAGLDDQARQNPPTGYGARGELHSVFSPGSKKQSLNHLLNFHYAPRDRDQPARFSRTGNNGYMRKHLTSTSYNKDQFLQANCQFVVRADEDYGALLAVPDQLVEWGKIEQIHVLSSEEPRCPICLYPPVAAKMTKCGHVYCWPCILHYLALSDKAWRKCPICYDAIHLPDLRPAVSKPFHAFGNGEYVTLQLMRREKGTMTVVPVMEEGAIRNNYNCEIPHFDAIGGNNILTKLLITDTEQMLNIMDRERMELENQLVADGADAPEIVFVQQALELLAEKRDKLVSTTVIAFPVAKKDDRAAIDLPSPPVEHEKHVESVDSSGEETTVPTSPDFVIDEDSNFTVGDIDIVPTAQCAGQHYYFYQSVDGQPLFLHSINSRMLQATYGSLDRSPRRVTGRVVHKDSCSMDENLRRRLKYLQHLPVCTQFEVVELDFGAQSDGPVSGEVLAQFQDELTSRRRTRQKRERAEQKREKQIFEFNERQLGKAMARSARISINSTKQFPTCGTNESYEEPSPLGSSPVPSDISSSSGSSTNTGLPSWSKMVSTQAPTNNQRWPTLGGAAAGPSTVTSAQKVVQVTGSRMTSTAGTSRGAAWHTLAPMSDVDEDENDEDVLAARAPRFNNNLGRAIEAALEKVSLPRATEGSATNGGGGKRKKNKKTLLFASGMNLS
ncbi:E3 ubiquitin-protein ligase RNF10 [Anopheles ziemanni]|uniref:E3 ubiquitin-protein ligase RNF10 n=1 Tax=Anopheles ziemanni TaxID=345580 RepID=UPI00265967A2|nr:E3 ubiquitin-protein ligase RNF10 isoform X2 [Anopheles coustani]XP_058168330.1 E3 ubiquitin-protein ligase RNF10 [Anopheles ziemanni]